MPSSRCYSRACVDWTKPASTRRFRRQRSALGDLTKLAELAAQLLAGTNLQLANALLADAHFAAKRLERRGLVTEDARLDDPAFPVGEGGKRGGNGVAHALNADQRAVIVLRIREGRSTREVAEILGVPQGTVMSRLKRGLARLREVLEPETPA